MSNRTLGSVGAASVLALKVNQGDGLFSRHEVRQSRLEAAVLPRIGRQ